MNKINKILIISVILSFFSFSLTLADNSDCGRFGIMSYSDKGSFNIVDTIRETENNRFSNFLSINEQQAILQKDDLNTAMLNLKKYCCENSLGDLSPSSETCRNDTPYFNDNALESSYLFDHILDVIMRRLNGLNGEKNIYTKTKMTLDDKGQERRERINEQATSASGTTPQIIINKFKEFRTKSPANKGFNIAQKIHHPFINKSFIDNQEFLLYVSGNGQNQSKDSKYIAEALKNYKDWTLYDRYLNSCALSEYFYALLSVGEDYEQKNETIKKLSSANSPCDTIIKTQIEGENAYVELVIKKSSNLFLSNYIEGYFSYVHERQKSFTKVWKDSVNKWIDIARNVPCLQHSCVK